MGILELMKPSLLVAGLMFISAGATAQTTPPPESNCKWPPPKTAGPKLMPGGITTMVSKNSGPKECRVAGTCKMDVQVQSYTNSAGANACCVRAEFGSFVVTKGTKKAVLRWDLKRLDSGRYYFDPDDGVKIVNPPATSIDFGKKGPSDAFKRFEMESVNGRDQPFDYGFTVFRKNSTGPDLECDPFDPVIVNQGE